MVLEYLVEKEEVADSVIGLITETNILKTKRKLTDTHFIVAIEMKGESELVAKKLSDIDNEINSFSPTVLSNGAAAYFNKVLFPLVNDFERKLRKLLYAASALNSSEENAIANLEEMDFGTIFDALFLDRDYWDRVKAFVVGNKKGGETWSGYSYELKAFINGVSENLLWDRLLPGQVPLLRESFSEIRLRRNDIMHAHNIKKQDYNKTRKLFDDVNKELDSAIEGLAEGALVPDTYNKEIENAFFIVTDSGEYLTDERGVPLIAD